MLPTCQQVNISIQWTRTNCSRKVCENESGSWQGWLGRRRWRMIICRRLVPPNDHFQEAGPSRWSFAISRPLQMIICNRMNNNNIIINNNNNNNNKDNNNNNWGNGGVGGLTRLTGVTKGDGIEGREEGRGEGERGKEGREEEGKLLRTGQTTSKAL